MIIHPEKRRIVGMSLSINLAVRFMMRSWDSNSYFFAQPESWGCEGKLNRHQPPHALGLHIFATTAFYDAAARHHQIAVDQIGGEVVELLDQQDRHVAFGGQLFDDRADLFDDRGLNAFGGFVEDQQRSEEHTS